MSELHPPTELTDPVRLVAGRGDPNDDAVTERTDEQRWADAQSIVDGDPSEFAVQELRRRRRRLKILLWSSLGLLLLLVAGSVVLIVVFGNHRHHAPPHHHVPVWQEITGLAVNGAGLVVIVVGLVGYVRSGAWRDAWRSPALVLTRAQRRRLSKEIRGREPLDPDHVRVARHVTEFALDPRVRRYFAFFLAGVVLEAIGQLISLPITGRLVFNGVALIAYAVAVVFWIGRQRRMRAFLEKTRASA